MYFQGGAVTVPIDEDVLEIIISFLPVDPDTAIATYLSVKGCFEESKSSFCNNQQHQCSFTQFC